MKKNSTTSRISTVLFLLLILLTNSILPGAAQTPLPSNPQELITLYLPIIRDVVIPTRDLTISAMEVTQAIQSLDNRVSLVSARPTVARVYARVNEAVALSNVTVSLSATRNGVNLAGSPMVSAAKVAYPLSTDANLLRADSLKSFNFSLPADWLSGQVILSARVDAGETYWENSEDNNTFNYTANFVTVPDLVVKVIPIRYTDPYGVVYPAPSGTYLQASLQSIFPVGTVNLTVRATPMYFTGNLTTYNGWVSLLDKVIQQKNTDGSPYSEVYYGLIPLLDATGKTTWFPYGGGIVGLGEVGEPAYDGPRAAIGVTSALGIDGGVTAAHEIGHNLGRLHSPCGDPGDLQPGYPYPNASIGQYGLNTNTLTVKAPSLYKDIMSYCSPEWISDFTYNGFLQSQLNFGDALPPDAAQPGLLLNGYLEETGAFQVQPSYILNAAPDGFNGVSEYQAQFLDAGGNVLSTHPLSIKMASVKDKLLKHFNSVLPLPAQAPAKLRVLHNDQVVLDRALSQSAAGTGVDQVHPAPSLIRTGETIQLNWAETTAPVMVRVSADGGVSWIILEMDVPAAQFEYALADLPQKNLIFEITPAWSLDAYRLEYNIGAP